MWVLRLNDMRSSKVEIMREIACADTKEELKAFVQKFKVKSYEENGWGKSFAKGSPLEWCNPPNDWWENEHYVNYDYLINVKDYL